MYERSNIHANTNNHIKLLKRSSGGQIGQAGFCQR